MFAQSALDHRTKPLAACADENPRLAAASYAAVSGTMLKKVAGFLKSLAKRRVLSIDDPELAGGTYNAIWPVKRFLVRHNRDAR
jgi:hypothetical protein